MIEKHKQKFYQKQVSNILKSSDRFPKSYGLTAKKCFRTEYWLRSVCLRKENRVMKY